MARIRYIFGIRGAIFALAVCTQSTLEDTRKKSTNGRNPRGVASGMSLIKHVIYEGGPLPRGPLTWGAHIGVALLIAGKKKRRKHK